MTGPPNYLDPDDPAPDQVAESLSGWHTLRLEAVWETLTRSDLDFAWDHDDQLVFHAPDRPAITAVLDRFRDAPLYEIDEVLDRYWAEDNAEPGRAITPCDIAAALALPAGAITTIDADPSVARSVDAGLLARPGLSRSLEPLRALSPGANKPPLGTRTPGIDPPVRAALALVDAPTPRPPETGGLQR